MINYARTITLNYFDLWTCKGSSASSEATQWCLSTLTAQDISLMPQDGYIWWTVYRVGQNRIYICIIYDHKSGDSLPKIPYIHGFTRIYNHIQMVLDKPSCNLWADTGLVVQWGVFGGTSQWQLTPMGLARNAVRGVWRHIILAGSSHQWGWPETQWGCLAAHHIGSSHQWGWPEMQWGCLAAHHIGRSYQWGWPEMQWGCLAAHHIGRSYQRCWPKPNMHTVCDHQYTLQTMPAIHWTLNG